MRGRTLSARCNARCVVQQHKSEAISTKARLISHSEKSRLNPLYKIGCCPLRSQQKCSVPYLMDNILQLLQKHFNNEDFGKDSPAICILSRYFLFFNILFNFRTKKRDGSLSQRWFLWFLCFTRLRALLHIPIESLIISEFRKLWLALLVWGLPLLPIDWKKLRGLSCDAPAEFCSWGLDSPCFGLHGVVRHIADGAFSPSLVCFLRPQWVVGHIGHGAQLLSLVCLRPRWVVRHIGHRAHSLSSVCSSQPPHIGLSGLWCRSFRMIWNQRCFERKDQTTPLVTQ